ncbi:MAG: right-handed parallel beta-helix repeat-containing protein [Candidatus Moraniibacteriota bacterium]|nr:MAG: right-handed parallel beta-helix repeat-containing protein [Candidatus Moranbacteria bacterium]
MSSIFFVAIGLSIIFFVFFNKKIEVTSEIFVEEQQEEVERKEKKYFISPLGNDLFDGLSEETAFATIQKAVDILDAGDRVFLLEGEYYQDIISIRSGKKEKPIIIEGTKNSIIKGAGNREKIVEIRHSFIHLIGFTLDGLVGEGNQEMHYRSKLLYIEGSEVLSGVTGMKVLSMNFQNAGGECIRIKYFSHENEIAYSSIRSCGVYDFVFGGGGKNGEGIYIGTAPEQITEDKNLTRDVDASNANWIHHNTIDTQGNECIDIKEGSSENIVEYNSCTGQKDSQSAGLDSRGNRNIFRENESFGNVGAGIRLGGDKEEDGIYNSIESNYFHNNEGGGVKLQRMPQEKICKNRFENNKKDDFVGEYKEEGKNENSC